MAEGPSWHIYSWLARYYDLFASLLLLPLGGIRSFYKTFLDSAGIKKGKRLRWCDLCCGTANLFRFCDCSNLDSWPLIVGLDGSKQMLEKAKGRSIKAFFVRTDVTQIPIVSNQFDVCTMSLCLHEMEKEKRDQALKEVHRILKEDARLAILDFGTPKNVLLRFILDTYHKNFEHPSALSFTREDLSSTLYRLGFKNVIEIPYKMGIFRIILAEK